MCDFQTFTVDSDHTMNMEQQNAQGADHEEHPLLLQNHTDFTEVKNLGGDGGELTVPKFYAGKCVFVTGATGFMGKVLIEKLLRCCPDIEQIYCLVRPKNSQDVQKRLNELLDCKVQ